MAAGLEIFDASGNLRVSLDMRLLRFLGTLIVGPGPVSGYVVNDGLLTGTPFWFATVHSSNAATYWPGEGLVPPDVSISGNVLSWYLNSGKPTTRIQYGVY